MSRYVHLEVAGEIDSMIHSISQHRYSGAFCSGGDFPLISFMSKASVRSNLTLWKPDIATVHGLRLRYILGLVFSDFA